LKPPTSIGIFQEGHLTKLRHPSIQTPISRAAEAEEIQQLFQVKQVWARIIAVGWWFQT